MSTDSIPLGSDHTGCAGAEDALRFQEEQLRLVTLHDEACQDLAAASIYLEQLAPKLNRALPEEASLNHEFSKVTHLIQLTQETLRQTARALHPSTLEH